MRTRIDRIRGSLAVVMLLPVLGLAACSDAMEPEEADGDLFLEITDPDRDLNLLVTDEPLTVRATLEVRDEFAQFISEVVYQLNDGPEEDCGGTVESIVCSVDDLSEGVNTIRVIGRTRDGVEVSDRTRVFYRPGVESPAVAATLDPEELEVANTNTVERTVDVIFWRTPDHTAPLGANADQIPENVEAETVRCVESEDEIVRECTIRLTFPAGMLPGPYEIRIEWGNSFLMGAELLPVQVTGAGPAGCEDLRLILDFEPEIPSASSDVVPVFIDRAPGVEGQVELALIEPEGVDLFTFGPNPVPPDEDVSILELTLVEDLPSGITLEMEIRGAIPLLEDPSFQCTIPLRVHVIDP